MKTGTQRYAENYEVAAYGESVVRWGYNHWWSKAFSLGFSGDTLKNLGRTADWAVISGWGVALGIFDVLNARSRADQRCRSGQDVPTVEMFSFADTPWARLCYGKKWLTQKLTGFKKKYVIKSIRKLMDTHRSDSFKIDPLLLGGPSWWTLSELPALYLSTPFSQDNSLAQVDYIPAIDRPENVVPKVNKWRRLKDT